jgi:hypothetical protein
LKLSRDNIQKLGKFMKLKGVRTPTVDRVNNFFELIWEMEIKMSTLDET